VPLPSHALRRISWRKRLGLTVVVLAAAATLAVPGAFADGDPASDVLLTQSVFVPYGAPVSPAVVTQLETVVARAKAAGYPIKVAIVRVRYDLGAVTSLYGKPQVYARFLGRELMFLYRGRLLVVMPQGFGYYDGRGRHGPELRVLRSLGVRKGPDPIVESTADAVARLARADGHPVTVPPLAAQHGKGGNRTFLVLGALIAAAILAFAIGLAVWLRGGAKLQDS
jgi:hypothetical protein